MTCWLWISLLPVLLLASGVYSAKDIRRSEEGKCRYDLTSVAALSCVQPTGAWRPPSLTCCDSLLYAIDHVPASGESGACCLCRYMKEKEISRPPGLVTTYVLCNGKDKHIIAKWSSFPITTCSVECRKKNNSSAVMATSVHEVDAVLHVHSYGKGIWIAIAIFVVTALICLWYFRRFKAAANASEKRQRLCLQGDSRAGPMRSFGPSSTQLTERRFSCS